MTSSVNGKCDKAASCCLTCKLPPSSSISVLAICCWVRILWSVVSCWLIFSFWIIHVKSIFIFKTTLRIWIKAGAFCHLCRAKTLNFSSRVEKWKQFKDTKLKKFVFYFQGEQEKWEPELWRENGLVSMKSGSFKEIVWTEGEALTLSCFLLGVEEMSGRCQIQMNDSKRTTKKSKR